MRYCVVGAGALGTWLGAHLLEDGNEVVYAESGARHRMLARDGVRAIAANGHVLAHSPVELLGDTADPGYIDLLLLCVRTPDTRAACARVRSLAAAESGVVFFQGCGVPNAALRASFDDASIICAVAEADVRLSPDGTAHATGTQAAGGVDAAVPRFTLGELAGRGSWRLDGLSAAFESAGLAATQSERVVALAWRHLALRGPLESASLRSALELRGVLPVAPAGDVVEMLRELLAVASAAGYPFDRGPLERQSTAAGRAKTFDGTMLRDLAAGRAPELGAFSGLVVEYAERLGVPAPVTSECHRALERATARLRGAAGGPGALPVVTQGPAGRR